MESLFYGVKSLLGSWLMPFPLALTALVLGLLLWRRRPRTARAAVLATAAILLLASWDPVTMYLLQPLETRYPKLRQPVDGARYVVVMGASHADHPLLPLSNRPNDAALYRLVEGITLYRRHPGSKLVLSGGDNQPEPHAEILARVARGLGVPETDMLRQEGSRDTLEEAERLVAMLGGEGLIVVTSAMHMPRTMLSFRRLGVEPVAAPTHFLGREQTASEISLPALVNLQRTTYAWHEYLGLAWAWLQGRQAGPAVE